MSVDSTDRKILHDVATALAAIFDGDAEPYVLEHVTADQILHLNSFHLTRLHPEVAAAFAEEAREACEAAGYTDSADWFPSELELDEVVQETRRAVESRGLWPLPRTDRLEIVDAVVRDLVAGLSARLEGLRHGAPPSSGTIEETS